MTDWKHWTPHLFIIRYAKLFKFFQQFCRQLPSQFASDARNKYQAFVDIAKENCKTYIDMTNIKYACKYLKALLKQ